MSDKPNHLDELVALDENVNSLEESLRNAPAWHRRPTGPGWWVCFTEISGHVHLSAARISEQELKRGACSACDWVYGPIPQPKIFISE